MQINISAGGVIIATFAPVVVPLLLFLGLVGTFAYLKASNRLRANAWLPITLLVILILSIIFFALHLDRSTYLHYIR